MEYKLRLTTFSAKPKCFDNDAVNCKQKMRELATYNFWVMERYEFIQVLVRPTLGWMLVSIICNYLLFIFTSAELFFLLIFILLAIEYILLLLFSFVRCLKKYNITRHPTLINYFVIFIKYYFFCDKCAHVLILVIISRTVMRRRILFKIEACH